VAIVFAARSRLAARRARRLEQQDELLLEDVEAMQRALVPAVPARLEGLAVSAAYFAADGPAAGGDFYDVFVVPAGKVAIILGDACGHGRDALARAALTRYTLRAYLQTGLEPRAALRLAGRTLADPQSFHFATAVLALYDSQSGTLTYATAGHPVPIIHGNGTPEPPSALASTPIGSARPTGRAQTKVSLPPGSAACFYSDGLTDARQPGGALFGRGRLVETLRSMGQRPAAAELLGRVRAQADISRDDMAACVIAPEASGAGAADGALTHVEELEADYGELSGADVGSFLQSCAISPAETAQALEQARQIASRFETALLTVHCTSAGATVVATPPEVQTHEVTIRPPADL
jgi:serine phosphatase RsbU (regulator of sigma subunit)